MGMDYKQPLHEQFWGCFVTSVRMGIYNRTPGIGRRRRDVEVPPTLDFELGSLYDFGGEVGDGHGLHQRGREA